MSTTEVIVVFGAAVWPGRIPSGAMRRRVEAAASAVKSNAASWVLVSGGLGKHPPAEAELMSELLIDMNVAPEKIIRDSLSTTTLGTIINTSKIIRTHFNEPVQVKVCSDQYHQPRCAWLFRMAGIKTASCPVPSGKEATGKRRWMLYQLREVLAFPWSTIQLLLHRWFGLSFGGAGSS